MASLMNGALLLEAAEHFLLLACRDVSRDVSLTQKKNPVECMHVYIFLYDYTHILVGGFKHLEQYQSMGRIIPYIIMENKKCSKPPTSIYNYTFLYNYTYTYPICSMDGIFTYMTGWIWGKCWYMFHIWSVWVHYIKYIHTYIKYQKVLIYIYICARDMVNNFIPNSQDAEW